jgi:hypothetical protein
VASFPITAPQRRRGIVRYAQRPFPISSGTDARAAIGSRRQDRALGVACLIACPAISGLFLGLVAVVCAYPTHGGNAVTLGSLVGGITFAANALAICLTACIVHIHATRRTRHTMQHALDN